MKLLRNHKGFTLFELMLGMTIFALLMTLVFDAIGSITIARARSMTRITLIEELYFFSEKLATQIKEGGIIDYEEYWNRQVMGVATQSGHYASLTGFGNYNGLSTNIGTLVYGSGPYYCASENTTNKVGSGGCMAATLNNGSSNQVGLMQRYSQYKLQFTDYNGNADADGGIRGDEDGDGNIRGDEDDKDIGDGPRVLTGATPELYLINPDTKERLYFRWTYKQDPGNPESCNFSTSGSGCLGNIEVLKLKGLDIGMSHSGQVSDLGAFDGEIDTWVCHPDWRCTGPSIPGYGTIPTGNDAEWVALFPNYVNVKSIAFFAYPEKDPWKSWVAQDCLSSCASDFTSPFIHPYVRLELTMGLAWERRKLISGDDPMISISTSISLVNSVNQ